MAFRLVDDVPLPPSEAGRGSKRSRYNFGGMKIGQAMIFDADDDGFTKTKNGFRRHRAFAAAAHYGRRHGCKFSFRLLPDGTAGI